MRARPRVREVRALSPRKHSLGPAPWAANAASPRPQVFLIIHHAPLVNSLADVILNGDLSEAHAKAEQDVPRSVSGR